MPSKMNLALSLLLALAASAAANTCTTTDNCVKGPCHKSSFCIEAEVHDVFLR